MVSNRAGVPGTTHLYRLFDCHDVLLYIGITVDLGTRWKKHMEEKYWWSQVRRTSTEVYDTWEDARRAEREAIVAEYPVHNLADVPVERRLAKNLARMLRAGEVPVEAGMTALLWDLAEVLAEHLGKIPEDVHQGADELGERWRGQVPDQADPEVPQEDDFEQWRKQFDSSELKNDDEPGYAMDARRKRMYELLIERGIRGYQPRTLLDVLTAESMGIHRGTLMKWLAEAVELGYIQRAPNGQHQTPRVRYIWLLRAGAESDIPGWR